MEYSLFDTKFEVFGLPNETVGNIYLDCNFQSLSILVVSIFQIFTCALEHSQKERDDKIKSIF